MAPTISVRPFEPCGRSVFTLRSVDAAGNTSESSGTVAVVPATRPKSVPQRIPAWAWQLLASEEHGSHGKAKGSWYAAWKNWRLHPFKLAT